MICFRGVKNPETQETRACESTMNDPLGNKNLNDGGESPSAYASAESSPSHSMATSLSMHSMQTGSATGGNEDEFVMVNSRSSGMTVSQSMSSFSPRSPSSPTQHINLSSIPSSMSVSGIDTLAKLEELNMQGFTSLPPVKSSPDNVQKIIENTIKSEVEKQTSPKQTSPTSQRSSVFSVFGRLFSKSASKPAEDKDKSKTNGSPNTSSSSPKLETSPPKICSRSIIFEEDEKSAVNTEVKEAASLLNNTASVEKLVQQSNDQILTPASAPKANDTEVKTVSSTETMKVPASSQEFCNDLNLCIAASAALAVGAPVATSENSSKSGKTHLQCPSSSNDHQRFTKNASTSSIHNDLKAILEESKESASSLHASISDGKKAETGVTSPASIKTSPKKRRSNKSVTSDESFKKPSSSSDQPAKPQREKKTRNKHSKSSDKKTAEQQKQPLDSKINVFEMLMKTTVSAVTESKTTTNTKHTPYRYSRDFLIRIRDERAKLIDNICPEIFRTHAYCISGAYWDPERYFNAMLHGERLYDFVNNNNSSVSNYVPKSVGQQTNRSQNNHNGRKWVKKHQTDNDRSKNNSTHVVSSLMGAQKSSSWSHQSQTPVSNQPLADKYLLDLLKNNSPGSPRNVDLMTFLNKKNNDYDERLVKSSQPRHSPLILTAQELEFSQMFSPANTEKPTGRTPERHHPTNSGSSPGSARSSNLSPSSMSSGQMASNSEDTEGDNSSDAYKQLVRNLNNHPLSSVPAGRVNAVDQLFNRSTLKSNEGPKQEDSNLIKQLLNLNLSTVSNEETNNSFNKHNRPHHYHHHHHNNQNYRHHAKPKSSKPMMPRRSPTSGNLESLMLKLKASERGSHEQEHFNKLLEKLVPTLGSHLTSTNGSNSKDDILKWFRSSSSATQNNRY